MKKIIFTCVTLLLFGTSGLAFASSSNSLLSEYESAFSDPTKEILLTVSEQTGIPYPRLFKAWRNGQITILQVGNSQYRIISLSNSGMSRLRVGSSPKLKELRSEVTIDVVIDVLLEGTPLQLAPVRLDLSPTKLK